MKKSLLKCLNSFRYAWNGLVFLIVNENNMRYHLLATILVILSGFWAQLSRYEWIAIVFCIGLVWVAEFINSAIEKLTDLVSPEFNPKAGPVKDIAAAAVLLTALVALIVGGIVFLPHFM